MSDGNSSKSDVFGFSDEAVSREPDEFAGMSDDELEKLYEIAEMLMDRDESMDRRHAMSYALGVRKRVSKLLVSGKTGVQRYGLEAFRAELINRIVTGDTPCEHGHFAGLTDCGRCYTRGKVKSGNPLPLAGAGTGCTHTRLDYTVPCPACASEAGNSSPLHSAIAEYTAKERRWRDEIGNKDSHSFEGGSSTSQGIMQVMPSTSPFSIPQIGNESEMSAIIAILLDRLGGSIELTPVEVEAVTALARDGRPTYTISSISADGNLVLERVGVANPTSPAIRWAATGTPVTSSGAWTSTGPVSNPSAPAAGPAAMGPTWAEDDEDLPF